MSESIVEKLFRLERELDSLKKAPETQKILVKKDALLSRLEELELTPQEATEMLLPQAAGPATGPLLELVGRRRIPVSARNKLLLHSNLLDIRNVIEDLLKKLEQNPEVQKRLALMAASQELGLTHETAAELLTPGVLKAGISQDASPASRTKRRARYWKNPHTEEIVKARSTTNGTLKRWANEHGESILENWLIAAEDLPEAMRE